MVNDKLVFQNLLQRILEDEELLKICPQTMQGWEDNHFEWFAESVKSRILSTDLISKEEKDRIGKDISISTLKRLLRYDAIPNQIKDKRQINSLSKLAIFVGVKNWFEFKAQITDKKLDTLDEINENRALPKIYHKLSIITGLTSSGKDTLLIYIFNELCKVPEYYHFLNKIVTRQLRIEEAGLGNPLNERTTLPYYVIKVERHLLEDNIHGKYFNIYYRYDNYAALDKIELLEVLKTSKEKHIIFIQPDITNIMNHKKELDNICEEVSLLKKNIVIDVRTILIDSDKETCKRRLKARGLDNNSRIKRFAKIDSEYDILKGLKEHDFFNFIINNSNDDAINNTIRELFSVLTT